MNGNSVITRVSIQEKRAFGSDLLRPQFSILDPECVYTLPKRQIENGVVDAFVHVMEQYLTYPVNSSLQDRFAEGVLQTLIEEGPKVLEDQTNYEAAANFMWSATVALNGWISPGVPQDWSTHLIGHELTALHNIDHARTLAIVLPGTMNIKRENKKEKIRQYGERIWGVNSGSDDEKIDQTIAKTAEFFESVGLPTTLPDYNVGKETIDIIIDRFEKRNFILGEKADITPEQVRLILKDRL